MERSSQVEIYRRRKPQETSLWKLLNKILRQISSDMSMSLWIVAIRDTGSQENRQYMLINKEEEDPKKAFGGG